MADEKRNTANDTQYYYDVKNEKVLMIFDGMVDGEDNPELIEKIENTIQNYFWSGAGMHNPLFPVLPAYGQPLLSVP